MSDDDGTTSADGFVIREWPELPAQMLRETASWLISLRRAREKCFAPHLFDEPAWDILLQLTAADPGEQLRVEGLAHLLALPIKIAQRWLNVLESFDLIAIRDDQSVWLTHFGITRMEAVLCPRIDNSKKM